MEVKDWFQFGLPSAILALLLWKGPGYCERIALAFVAAIDKGFARIEAAVVSGNDQWRKELQEIHRENREDNARDQQLRHRSNEVVQAALSRMQVAESGGRQTG